MKRSAAVSLLIAAAAVGACGGGPSPEAPVVVRETPEAQILRIGAVWEARQGGKAFRTKPDPIAVVELETISTLRLESGSEHAEETIAMRETYQMRDGGQYVCLAEGSTRVGVRYGEKSGEPAVEVTRPPLTLTRTCQPPDFADLEAELGSGPARFVLRGDQLVAFDPPLEKRVYLPVD